MASSFAQDNVSKVRAAADIVDVVSRLVDLKQKGVNLLGLCPFHSEKTPSFTVNREKQFFHCFGCGTGGDVFDFVMRSEGLEFKDALIQLAARYSVEIAPSSEMGRKAKSRREAIFAANELARGFFEKCLESPEGESALQYLKRRGMDGPVRKAFGLGFAPDQWQALEKYLNKKGVDRRTALDAGLLAEKDGRIFDRFRNRIMFPIENIHGQVLGFGGRVMDDSLPKYLNSPQSPVYDKKRVLYGLGAAMGQARKSGVLFVVEGYFDMLALWAAGIKNAAATCGTALSQEHASAMRGYAKKVVLVFDADLAGQKAAERSLPIFLSQGLEASAMILPQGHDPDSFVREFGAQAFEDAAQKSLSLMDFLTEAALARHGESIQGRAAAADELAAHLRAIDDSVVSSLYIKRVANRLKVAETAIVQKVNIAGKKLRRQPGPEQGQQAQQDLRLEKQLAAIMLHNPQTIASVRERGLLTFFENPAYRSIAQVLLVRAKDLNENPDFNLLAFLDDPEQRRLAAELYAGDPDPDPAYLENLLDQCAARCERMTTAELWNKLKLADEQNDKDLRALCLAKLNPKKTG